MRKKSSNKLHQIGHQISIPSLSSSSWGSRLKKYRPIFDEHLRKKDFESWSQDLWNLCNWWLEVADEYAAGIVFDLVDEFKKVQSQSKGFIMIPKICGNLFLDKLQAKALVNLYYFINN